MPFPCLTAVQFWHAARLLLWNRTSLWLFRRLKIHSSSTDFYIDVLNIWESHCVNNISCLSRRSSSSVKEYIWLVYLSLSSTILDAEIAAQVWSSKPSRKVTEKGRALEDCCEVWNIQVNASQQNARNWNLFQCRQEKSHHRASKFTKKKKNMHGVLQKECL